MATTAKVLCAVYTRKSTEEGLDQDFNSLDAQHEACANYIASQKSGGWVMLKDHLTTNFRSSRFTALFAETRKPTPPYQARKSQEVLR